MAKSLFEKEGGEYVECGDYELPAVELPSQEEVHVGIWGDRYRRWLKENHRVIYYNLLTSCKLHEVIAEVDERAEKRFDWLVYKMAWKEQVDEELKAEDPMTWGRHMNNIRQRVTETVLDEILTI